MATGQQPLVDAQRESVTGKLAAEEPQPLPPAMRTVVLPEGATLREARARFEREYIAATLAHHRGRISEAAKALGIQRTNLYRKIRALQLDRTTMTVPGRS